MRRKYLKVADMTKIPNRYKGQWVSIILPGTKVVASGNSPKEVLEASSGTPNVCIVRVPKESIGYLL